MKDRVVMPRMSLTIALVLAALGPALAKPARPGTAGDRNVLGARQAGAATTGGSGSSVPLTNGSSLTYTNSFGGTWASTPGDFSARAQSYSPALNEEWDWNNQRIYGVNLGGWLVTEPFIVPELYLPYQNANPKAVDEFTLSQAMGSDLADKMTQHYETFITEQDFANIAAAGLNWIRLPVPYWAIDVAPGEPYLEGVAWNYMIRALDWARKYGLRVNLDLHTVPGSQNGLNHSGKQGQVGWLVGVMGIANAQRTLNYIRILTELVSGPNYKHVQMFNIVNEAYVTNIGRQVIGQFYLEAYNEMRGITGIGAGKGPFMAIHDGFVGLNTWPGFLKGADRLAIESHYYFAFSPDAYTTDFGSMVNRPCQWWASGFNNSALNFGVTVGGEWSLAPNDCGIWLNAVGEGAKYDGTHSDGTAATGSCTNYIDVANFSNNFKQQLQAFTYASMDTFQNFMFWTWKTQTNSTTGRPYNPLWCYSCGLQYGYIPTDPRGARGACDRNAANLGVPSYGSRVPITQPYAASMTGDSGTSSSIVASQQSQYGQWPPTSITNIPQATRLPAYTATGQEPALPTAVPSPISVAPSPSSTGTGWYVPIQGCSYMNAYSGVGAGVPPSRCTGTPGGNNNSSGGPGGPNRNIYNGAQALVSGFTS